MKSLSRIEESLKRDSTPAHALIRVAMHVLGTAHTDVRVMREAIALVAAGYAVTIIDIVADPALPAAEEIQGVHIKHIIMPSWFIPTRFKPWFLVKAVQLFIRRVVQLMRVPADVYHAHDETALPACYLVSRLHCKPLIFDAHELPLLQHPSSEISLKRRWLHAVSAWLVPHIISHSAAVITVSPPIAQHIDNRYHVPKVTVVRNIPVYHRVMAKSEQLRCHLGLSSNTRIALYQGILLPERGLDALIRAAKFLEPDIVIVMMGNGSREIVSQLEALTADEEAADHVKIIPAVPYKNLLDWTASADIGLIIYPPDYSMNVRMCLPNKLFEYLMAGLPILSSQLDAVSEVIKNYCCGQIASSLSPRDIAAAINTMLADLAALALMRRNALEATRREFNWEKESQLLVQLYHDILGAPAEEKNPRLAIRLPH